MSNSTQPKTSVRVMNGLIALALAAFVLGIYWPTVRTIDLDLADLGYQGQWIEGYAKRVTAVTPGGPADRAGVKTGDVLEFNPAQNADWVLAGYRDMPEGFTGNLIARHADGTRSSVTLAPVRTAYLPTLNDRLALVVRLAGFSFATLIGVVLVWTRPCLMTWSFMLAMAGSGPGRVWWPYFLAYAATIPDSGVLQHVVNPLLGNAFFLVIFALCFPNPTVPGWSRWKRTLVIAASVPAVAMFAGIARSPFVSDSQALGTAMWVPFALLTCTFAIVLLVRTYRRSEAKERARLKWAILGLSVYLSIFVLGTVLIVPAQWTPGWRSGNPLTPTLWLFALAQGVLLPLIIGYAVLRQRVVDVQFALSRTVVYGIVSTIVLVFLAVLHWLLGRMIEHSRLAVGLEGLAAVGLGLALHRASHGINVTVDRVLFRRHHAAEERLRQVTAALPYASTERSITEALVNEPAHNLQFASAALFYRNSPEGPLQRVRSEGWDDSHASSLDPESLLVRYLQAEHTAVRLDDEQQWLPPEVPDGSAHPVLAVPIVSQHSLSAVVLYGSHVNGTLPDPDEVELLAALAKAAATSHLQVRIATLSREVETQKIKNEQLEASFRLLAQARVGTPPVEGVQ
ncbi:MAG: hypothetical protein H6Q33_5387 [Deltaproteobacteria bacterium]|nr:hypothetical protein [Deltaproteobacteria bacterium]